MTAKISISDFRFYPISYGQWGVTYTSPVTRKEYDTITTNSRLIDATKNAENPKQIDLRALKRLCKR